MCVRYELDVTLFFPARIELGGSSVAARAGVQLGVSVTSSMSSIKRGVKSGYIGYS